MKKLWQFWCVCSVAVFLTAVPALATLSLGGWNEGDVGSTHQFWDFTPGYVTAIPGDGYSAIPEQVNNPDPLNVVASISPGGTWDGISKFIGTTYLTVNLELPNYPNLNEYKEIWVDLGDNVVVDPLNLSISATPTNISFEYEVLAGQGDAEFGFRIRPNPYVEKVGFTLLGASSLDYIHVDTICIPEPATMGLLAFGGLLLRRRKRV